MRILTIAATPYFSDRGCHIRIFLEAKYLKKQNAEISLCTYHLGSDVGDFVINRTSDVSWYQKTSPGFAWGKIWLDLKLLFLCVEEIKKFKPTIIHAHLFEGLAIGYLAKLLAGKKHLPLVVDLQGDLKGELESYNKKNGFVATFFVKLSKKIINLADFVVVSSENAFVFFEKLVKDPKKLEIIRDGIDLELFNQTAVPNETVGSELEILKKWKGERKLLIYAGGMEDSKGAKSLLLEFLKNKKKLANWGLVLYGAGKNKAVYQQLVVENKAEEQIYFVEEHGFFSLPYFLGVADLAIDPKKTSTESSGKLMNYMATGLPIICFDNQFNHLRLAEEGSYLKEMAELEKVLNSIEIVKIKYNLTKESQENEANKLFKIFNNLITEK